MSHRKFKHGLEAVDLGERAVDPFVDIDFRLMDNPSWESDIIRRFELRATIACTFSVEQDAPLEALEHAKKNAERRLMREMYGDIKHELIDILVDLRRMTAQELPPMEKLRELIDELG